MKKKSAMESDEVRLKKSLQTRRTAGSEVVPGPAFRRLRKRLKRVQRKRRRLALRKLHAAGKKVAEGAQKA
jgi:hypothetical protein